MRIALLALLLPLVAGCPSPTTSDTGSDVPTGLDTPALDVPGTDTPGIDTPGIDTPMAADVPVTDAPSDGGLTCSVPPIPDFMAGVCDGRGMIACTRWAEDLEPGAVAQCVPPDGRCARADACGAAGCTCGGGPECNDDQLCVARPGGGFGCRCLPSSGACTEPPVPDFVAGVCDGIGAMSCTMWAQGLGGSMAVAQCVRPDGRCARADACGAAGCTCGRAPECADNEMCVVGIAGASCVCIP